MRSSRQPQQHLLVIEVQSHSVTNEVLGTRFQPEFLVDGLHTILVEVDAWIQT
jgi:hypothetical protein